MTRLRDIGTAIRAFMPARVKNAIIDHAQRQMVPLSFRRIGYQLLVPGDDPWFDHIPDRA